MEQMIPGFLEEMLKKQYGEEAFAKILAGYQARRPVTLRVNPLKADRNSVEQALTGAGIAFKNVSWYEDDDHRGCKGAGDPGTSDLSGRRNLSPEPFLHAAAAVSRSKGGRVRPRYGCRSGRKDDPDGGDDGKSGADHGLREE